MLLHSSEASAAALKKREALAERQPLAPKKAGLAGAASTAGREDAADKSSHAAVICESLLRVLIEAVLLLGAAYLGYRLCLQSTAGAPGLLRVDGGSASQDCQGVSLPQLDWKTGLNADGLFFPEDLFNDEEPLQKLLRSQSEFEPLKTATQCAKSVGLFGYPTFPWAQWTWLKLLSQRPNLMSGTFAEFGVGLGGSSVFLASLARLHGAKFIGFDSFTGLPKSDSMKDLPYFTPGMYDFRITNGDNEQLDSVTGWVKSCGGFNVPNEVQFVKGFFKDVRWPQDPSFERLSFVHLDSDLYDSIYRSLEMVYDRVVEGGIIAIDDFFHPAMGPKRALEAFMRQREPGRAPLLLPVFPGYAVILIKGRFADPSEGHRQNALDGSFYGFELIKGQPEIAAAVERSYVRVHEAYEASRQTPFRNRTQTCQLSVSLDNVERLRTFVNAPLLLTDGSESGEILRFLQSTVQFQDSVSRDLHLRI